MSHRGRGTMFEVGQYEDEETNSKGLNYCRFDGLALGLCVGKIFGPVLSIRYGHWLGFFLECGSNVEAHKDEIVSDLVVCHLSDVLDIYLRSECLFLHELSYDHLMYLLMSLNMDWVM